MFRSIPLNAYIAAFVFVTAAAGAIVLKDRAVELRGAVARLAGGPADLDALTSELVKKSLVMADGLQTTQDQAIVRGLVAQVRAAMGRGDKAAVRVGEDKLQDLLDIVDLNCEIRPERTPGGAPVVFVDDGRDARIKGSCWTPRSANTASKKIFVSLRTHVFLISPNVDVEALSGLPRTADNSEVILGKKLPGRVTVDWSAGLKRRNQE